MRHRVYVNEQLQPAEFDDAVDYNILDALGRANIDYESHCCMGWCGTCRVVLVSGQVKYPGGKPLGYIRDGEILPCCCVPTSDIEIKTLF
jgi:ferredoxin|tara:strand:+ start:8639 stop:8908 length:270 start_codon:yes stop_codon:yes gene_type:complete